MAGKPGIFRPSACRFVCCTASLARSIHGRQQRLQLLQLLRARRTRVRARKHQAQVVLQSHVDRLIERKRKNPRHRRLLHDAALVCYCLPAAGACPGDGAGMSARPRTNTSGLHPVPHNSPGLRLILESTSACNLMALKKRQHQLRCRIAWELFKKKARRALNTPVS